MRQRTRTIGLVAAGLLAGLACGEPVRMIGDAMVDAGEALMDAGRGLVDAGDAMTSDAEAQPMIVTAECDVTEGAARYAEATVSIDPESVRSVIAIACDLDGDFVGSGRLPCMTTTARFSSTRVRAFCGNGDPAAGGYVHRTVRFVID